MRQPVSSTWIAGSAAVAARPSVRETKISGLGLYQAGRQKLDELITRRYTIAEAPQAFDDRANGRNARGMIVF